jgi:GAF domain
MTSRVVRIALLLAALGALGAGGFVIVDAEREIRAADTARTMFDEQARGVLGDIGRLRSAQQAYVAEGQGPDYWVAQATERLTRVERGLSALVSDGTDESTRASVQAAAAALGEFRKLDQRARQYVASGQRLMASDVIFAESLAAGASIADRVDAARTNEAAVQAAAIEALHLRQLYAAAGAAALVMLVMLLLAPVPEKEVDVLTAMRALTEPAGAARLRPEAAPAPPPAPVVRPPDFSLDSLDEGAVLLPPQPRVPISVGTPLKSTSPPSIDLTKAARVCTDLARVLDAGDLPGLLTRAADVLKAPGLIVWVADHDGRALYPLITHGYATSTVLRMGTLSTDADNATAAAWRTGEMRAVPATDEAPGALVAPIVTAEGCVGVLAAEVQDGRELRSEVRALATIFAAQLATLVTALPASGAQSLAAEA